MGSEFLHLCGDNSAMIVLATGGCISSASKVKTLSEILRYSVYMRNPLIAKKLPFAYFPFLPFPTPCSGKKNSLRFGIVWLIESCKQVLLTLLLTSCGPLIS